MATRLPDPPGPAVPHRAGGGDEADAIALLARLLPAPPPGEVWLGDDAAVLRVPGQAGAHLLLAADALVAGLDADLSLTSLADLGWKALAVNVSDIAAMGGTPLHAVVSVVGLGVAGLEELYAGLLEASEELGCPVVGGDLSGGAQAMVSVAVTGWCEGAPVLRSGARPGDVIWATGAFGAAAAGLRGLRSGTLPVASALALAHARPRPGLAEGAAARATGATAMVDVSDGLVADLGHIADASGVGYHLDEVPVAAGATMEEALEGGDDYVLVFTAPEQARPGTGFSEAGLPSPHRLGRCVEATRGRLLRGAPVASEGWQHRLG